jgi:hypothetical protein
MLSRWIYTGELTPLYDPHDEFMVGCHSWCQQEEELVMAKLRARKGIQGLEGEHHSVASTLSMAPEDEGQADEHMNKRMNDRIGGSGSLFFEKGFRGRWHRADEMEEDESEDKLWYDPYKRHEGGGGEGVPLYAAARTSLHVTMCHRQAAPRFMSEKLCEDTVRCGKTAHLLQLLAMELPASQEYYRLCGMPFDAAQATQEDENVDPAASERPLQARGVGGGGSGTGAGSDNSARRAAAAVAPSAASSGPFVIGVAFTEHGVESIEARCNAIAEAQEMRLAELLRRKGAGPSRGARSGEEGRIRSVAQEEEDQQQKADEEERKDREEERDRKQAAMAGIEGQIADNVVRAEEEAEEEAKQEAAEIASKVADESVRDEAEMRIRAKYDALAKQQEKQSELNRWRMERRKRVRTTRTRLKSLLHNEKEAWKVETVVRVGDEAADGEGNTNEVGAESGVEAGAEAGVEAGAEAGAEAKVGAEAEADAEVEENAAAGTIAEAVVEVKALAQISEKHDLQKAALIAENLDEHVVVVVPAPAVAGVGTSRGGGGERPSVRVSHAPGGGGDDVSRAIYGGGEEDEAAKPSVRVSHAPGGGGDDVSSAIHGDGELLSVGGQLVSIAVAPLPIAEYCRILGVRPNSTPQQLSAAYKAQSLRYHPDQAKAGSAEASTEAFQGVAAAYAALTKHAHDAQWGTTSGAYGSAQATQRLLLNDEGADHGVVPHAHGARPGISSNSYASDSRQNTGNVLTDRATTRVLMPPGGAATFSIGTMYSGGGARAAHREEGAFGAGASAPVGAEGTDADADRVGDGEKVDIGDNQCFLRASEAVYLSKASETRVLSSSHLRQYHSVESLLQLHLDSSLPASATTSATPAVPGQERQTEEETEGRADMQHARMAALPGRMAGLSPPLELVLGRCIGAAVHAQCRLVDRLALRLFLRDSSSSGGNGGGDGGDVLHGGLGLWEHLFALRRYALMASGHCAEVFVRLLCERQAERGFGGDFEWTGQHTNLPSQFELQSAALARLMRSGGVEEGEEEEEDDGPSGVSLLTSSLAASQQQQHGQLPIAAVNNLWRVAQHMAGLADSDPHARRFQYKYKVHAADGKTGQEEEPLAFQPLAKLQLEFELEWPIGAVISEGSLAKYQQIHSFLLCHRHASKTLQELWLAHKNVGRERSAVTIRTHRHRARKTTATTAATAAAAATTATTTAAADGHNKHEGAVMDADDGAQSEPVDPAAAAAAAAAAARRMRWRQLFQHELMHFVRIVEGYLVTQVLDGCWHWLERRVPAATHIGELRQLHEEYLDKALSRAFLRQSAHVLGCIVSCYKNIFRFHAIISAHPFASDLPEYAFAQLVQQRESFQRQTRFLYQVLEQASAHGGDNGHIMVRGGVACECCVRVFVRLFIRLFNRLFIRLFNGLTASPLLHCRNCLCG